MKRYGWLHGKLQTCSMSHQTPSITLLNEFWKKESSLSFRYTNISVWRTGIMQMYIIWKWSLSCLSILTPVIPSYSADGWYGKRPLHTVPQYPYSSTYPEKKRALADARPYKARFGQAISGFFTPLLKKSLPTRYLLCNSSFFKFRLLCMD